MISCTPVLISSLTRILTWVTNSDVSAFQRCDRNVQVMGWVVEARSDYRLRCLTIDDGTGLLLCKVWKPVDENGQEICDDDEDLHLPEGRRGQVTRQGPPRVGLGDVVRVQGHVKAAHHRGVLELSLTVESMQVENREPLAEALHWMDAMNNFPSFLSRFNPGPPPREAVEQSAVAPGLGQSASRMSSNEARARLVQFIARQMGDGAQFSLEALQLLPEVHSLAQSCLPNFGSHDPASQLDSSPGPGQQVPPLLPSALANGAAAAPPAVSSWLLGLVRAMIKQGDAYVMEDRTDTYMLTSDRGAIMPAALEWVRKAVNGGSAGAEGVAEQAIIAGVRSNWQLQNVAEERILTCVDMLVEDGLLYDASKDGGKTARYLPVF
eukprot:jgi/Mesvir1/12226/Mv26388-RA.1